LALSKWKHAKFEILVKYYSNDIQMKITFSASSISSRPVTPESLEILDTNIPEEPQKESNPTREVLIGGDNCASRR